MNFDNHMKLHYKLFGLSHSHLKNHLDIFDVSYHLIYLIKNDYKIRLHFFKDYFDVKDEVKLRKINYIEKNSECMICYEEICYYDRDEFILEKAFECSHGDQICIKCFDKLCNSKKCNIRCPMCRGEIISYYILLRRSWIRHYLTPERLYI